MKNALSDDLNVYGFQTSSRLLLGTARYPSPAVMVEAIEASGSAIVTVGLRRQSPEDLGGAGIWDQLRDLNCRLLPNTAGCRTAREAIAMAKMAREIFDTPWLKLEVIGDDYTLQPDPFELLEAAAELVKDGFQIFPYCTEDLVLCEKLLDVGCELLMPWASPIGTGRGISNPYGLQTLRERLPNTTLIVDAGIGTPSQAARVMEMGFDAVLLNTAVAEAGEPVQMAKAFSAAIYAGRVAREAGVMQQRQTAQPSTPTTGMPFWHQERAGAAGASANSNARSNAYNDKDKSDKSDKA